MPYSTRFGRGARPERDPPHHHVPYRREARWPPHPWHHRRPAAGGVRVRPYVALCGGERTDGVGANGFVRPVRLAARRIPRIMENRRSYVVQNGSPGWQQRVPTYYFPPLHIRAYGFTPCRSSYLHVYSYDLVIIFLTPLISGKKSRKSRTSSVVSATLSFRFIAQ